jgi:hypothetical protein
MPTEEMILAEEFCIHHNIEISFIYSLKESGLIEIVYKEEKTFVPVSQLAPLEKMVRLYHEMGINLEGIETITYLLQRMSALQQQMLQLTNRLRIYEEV